MSGNTGAPGPQGPSETVMSQTSPQPIPQKRSLFGWVSQTRSPGASRFSAAAPVSAPAAPSPEPMQTIASEPIPTSATTSDTVAGFGPARSPSVRRPRRDSSGLTHDEALNISRAGLSPPASSPGATAMARNRQRSNSKYDKLGLMAAYSGGPSSF